MAPKKLWTLLAFLLLALVGCATPGSTPVSAPPQTPTYYYVGARELTLKATPDSAGADGALVRLNERVQSLERRGGWFLVRTAGGQEGWVNDRDLNLQPVNRLYVRRWGVHLRQAPDEQAKSLERLQTNDQVKILEQNDQGWTRVTVARTGNIGWVKSPDLSQDRVAVRRPVKKRSQPTPAPAGLPMVTPSSAEAAPPPPAEIAPPPPSTPRPGTGKAKPDRFEPF
jgi:SH3-like domain-containing protein